jgi:hypothetical protein
MLDRSAAVRTFAPLFLAAVATGTKPKAPTEIKLFSLGENETMHGKFTLDAEGGASILEAFKRFGNDMAIDYEHQTFEKSSGPVPVAGWIPQGGLSMRDDGLYAAVKWTAKATELIEALEYRYTSPVFLHRKSPEGVARVFELQPVALVNYPARMGMDPLIAKGAKQHDARSFDRLSVDGAPSFDSIRNAVERAFEKISGSFGYITDIFDDAAIVSTGGKLFRIAYRMEGDAAVIEGEAVPVARVYTETPEDPPMKLTLKALKLAETTTDAELALFAARNAEAVDELIKLTGSKDLDEARGAFAAIVKKANAHDVLAAEVEALKLSGLKAEEAAILDEAIKTLKLSPAEAKELGERPGAATEAGVKWLRGYALKLTAKAPNEATGERKIVAAKKGAVETTSAEAEIAAEVLKLSPRQKSMAKSAGLTLEKFAAASLRRRGRVIETEDTDGEDAGGKE